MQAVSYADIETTHPSYEKIGHSSSFTSKFKEDYWKKADTEGAAFITKSQLKLNNLIQVEDESSDEHCHTPLSFQPNEPVVSFVISTGEWLQPVIPNIIGGAFDVVPVWNPLLSPQHFINSSFYIANKPDELYEVNLPLGTEYHLKHVAPIVSIFNFSEIDDSPIKEIGPIEDIVSNILSFHTLKQDWDGYGAIPSNVKTCANSISFLVEVKEFKDYITEVYPNPHGTISIEWEKLNNERLVVEIGEDGFSFYIKYDDEPLITGEFDTSDIAAEKISQHLKKLFP